MPSAASAASDMNPVRMSARHVYPPFAFRDVKHIMIVKKQHGRHLSQQAHLAPFKKTVPVSSLFTRAPSGFNNSGSQVQTDQRCIFRRR